MTGTSPRCNLACHQSHTGVSWVIRGAPYRLGGRYSQRTPPTEATPELKAQCRTVSV
jgi:hypothetical protein